MNAPRAAISLLLVLLASADVIAEEPSTDVLNFVSSRTRSEVRTELFAYKKAGVNPWATFYNQLRDFHSVTTRAQVMAGYFAFRTEGEALYSEDSGSFFISRAWSAHPELHMAYGIEPTAF